MTTTTTTTEPASDQVAAATQLVVLALDPARRPATDDGYRELIDRYHSSAAFSKTVRRAADGMGLVPLHSDDIIGLVLAARPSSALATDARWFRQQVTVRSVEDRLLYGMIVAGIAAYSFPSKQALVDPSTEPFHVVHIDEFISSHTAQVAAGDIALEDDLVGAWQAWDDRPQAELTQGGSYKAHTRLKMIQQVCHLLADLGLLLPDSRQDDTFRPTDRFRHHLAAHAGTLAYHAFVHSPVVDTFIWPADRDEDHDEGHDGPPDPPASASTVGGDVPDEEGN